MPAARVAEWIRRGGESQLRGVRLFDVCAGKPILPEDVSLAFPRDVPGFRQDAFERRCRQNEEKVIDRFKRIRSKSKTRNRFRGIFDASEAVRYLPLGLM